jgi:hypothetical protein
MVGDIFVGALLITSGIINLLAIGAFWVTPSLRTTANRFVINLLIANFISCLILSPIAFNVNANAPTTSIASFNDSKIVENVVKVDNNETLSNQTTLDDGSSATNIMKKYQSWSLDSVVALSVLS